MGQYSTASFEKGLELLGITLSEKQMQQFIDYYELLVEWNKVMNLTAITEYEEVIEKHFIDSLASPVPFVRYRGRFFDLIPRHDKSRHCKPKTLVI